MRFPVQCAAVAACVVLTACGGGGGGGDSAPPITGSTTPSVTISSANQAAVSQEAVSAQGSATSSAASSASVLTGAQVFAPESLLTTITHYAAQLPSLAAAHAGTGLVGATESKTGSCTYGGSLTISANDADNSQTLTPGDSFTLSFNGCNSTSSGVLGGSMTYRVNAYSGDLQSKYYNASFTVSANRLSFQTTGASSLSDGDLTIALGGSGTNNKTITLSSTAMWNSVTIGGETRSRALNAMKYQLVRTANVATPGYVDSETFSGYVTSTALDTKTVRFQTTKPILTTDTNRLPYSGQMEITGVKNGKVRITAVDSSSYTSELDADGDGVYAPGVSHPWSDLGS